MKQKRATISRQVRLIAPNVHLARQNESAVESLFTNRARSLFDGHVLTYDNRKKLMGLAVELGIERFRANLLIAMAQHGEGRIEPARVIEAPKRGWGILGDLSAAFMIQGVLMLAVYFIWFR